MKFQPNTLTQMFLCATLLCATAVQSGSAKAQQAAPTTEQNNVTAIDILLEPDATMVQHAKAANARFLKNYPKGFTLGGLHAPHLTILQRYVKTADPDKVYAAAGKVFAKENPTTWKLKAFKYTYLADGAIGGGVIEAEPTPDLLRLQQELIDAVAPFTVPAGTSAAFVTTPQDPEITPVMISYVADFVPKASGDHYVPHVTVGVASMDFLKALVAEPFDAFTFSPAGAAVYHIGHYGTAAIKLHTFKLK
jgi:hypothetical protein